MLMRQQMRLSTRKWECKRRKKAARNVYWQICQDKYTTIVRSSFSFLSYFFHPFFPLPLLILLMSTFSLILSTRCMSVPYLHCSNAIKLSCGSEFAQYPFSSRFMCRRICRRCCCCCSVVDSPSAVGRDEWSRKREEKKFSESRQEANLEAFSSFWVLSSQWVHEKRSESFLGFWQSQVSAFN